MSLQVPYGYHEEEVHVFLQGLLNSPVGVTGLQLVARRGRSPPGAAVGSNEHQKLVSGPTMVVSNNSGPHFESPYNKDHSILGLPVVFWKLPYRKPPKYLDAESTSLTSGARGTSWSMSSRWRARAIRTAA